MNITKGQLLKILELLDSDPQFFSLLITTLFKRLPKNLASQLAYDLYTEYSWEDETYELYNHLNKTTRVFLSVSHAAEYLYKLGYDVTITSVKDAFDHELEDYCNHSFKKREAKII